MERKEMMHHRAAIAVFAHLLLGGTLAWAGTLSGAMSAPAGPVSSFSGFVAVPAALNQDNVTAIPFTGGGIVILKLRFSGLGPADVLMGTTDTSGVTEYAYNLTVIKPSDEQSWTQFKVALGTGVGDEFVPAADLPLPGLDFDWEDSIPGIDPNSTVIGPTQTTLSVDSPSQLTWSWAQPWEGGGSDSLQFSIDIPDLPGQAFTLRVEPVGPSTVPEPATGVLLIAGGAWLVGRGRRSTGR